MKVLTIGTFDLIHSGHIKLFANCRTLAGSVGSVGEVIVGVNTDEFVLQYKKVKPIIPFEHRLNVIKNIRDVDIAIPNNLSNIEPILSNIKPRLLVIGSDWAKKDYLKQIGTTLDWLEDKNILLVYVPYTDGISTSMIKNNIGQ